MAHQNNYKQELMGNLIASLHSREFSISQQFYGFFMGCAYSSDTVN